MSKYEIAINCVDRGVEAMGMGLDDLESAPENVTAIDDCRRALRDIERGIELLTETSVYDVMVLHAEAVKECLTYGLMTMEARYGQNSNEHASIREILNSI